jgi:hypothetical protein
MYTRSILAMLAAVATLMFLVMPGQAAPAVGLGDAGTTPVATRANFVEICDTCQVAEEDDDDDDDDMTDLLLMGAELL